MYYNNNVVKSAMSSGIQWDMVMHFVNQENDAEGNLFDVRKQNIDRHMGTLTLTGKNNNDKVQNIYDLEGNCREYVAEKNNISRPFVCRGGNYNEDSSFVASLRDSDYGNGNSYKTFRPTLYMM